MNKTNLKPLAWGLLGAGVAVMGTAGALDLPSWLRHSNNAAVTAPGTARPMVTTKNRNPVASACSLSTPS